MDQDRIAAAMDQAWRQLTDAPHAGAGAIITAVIYDRPTAPDAHGFVAIGELREPARERIGVVLLHPATGSIRLTWAAAA